MIDFTDPEFQNNPHPVYAHLGAVTAMGRVGEPAEIAGVIEALLGAGTGWVTGQRIEASGGMLL